MFRPFEAFIGLRYVRARRRNHFISFISLSSVLGVTLGVMALITVLSVMNGFEKEMTDRTLGMVSHAIVQARGDELREWPAIVTQVEGHPGVLGAAPYYRAEGMLTNNNQVSGTVIRGVIPEYEQRVSDVGAKMAAGTLDDLRPGEFNIVLGSELARTLGVYIGDRVTLVAPQFNATPAGVLPRQKRFTVSGIFEIGMNEYDSALALAHMDDILKLYRADHPEGLVILTDDVMNAPRISREAMQGVPGEYAVIDWTEQHRNFFRALKTEKTVMFIILSLIVAVAAFNIVSTLVMVVVDKQADIAVLRTMGASPGAIMKIFMIQGTLIGLIGMLLGDISGVWLSLNIADLVGYFEAIFNIDVLPCDIYYVCDFPSDLHRADVIAISGVAFLLCFCATLYPAWRAAETLPAEALRYE
jgi:lipoprotein-releasing system permease protein